MSTLTDWIEDGLDHLRDTITDALTDLEDAVDDLGSRIQFGDGSAERLVGTARDDTIAAAGGADTVLGGAGDDLLLGNAGADVINAGVGQDSLFGGSGDDTLRGGAGTDLIYGGTGNDVINGGPGDDILGGGLGNDIFRFTALADGINERDVVTDFDLFSDDRLILDVPDPAAPGAYGIALDGQDVVITMATGDVIELLGASGSFDQLNPASEIQLV
ncbi:hypothetical protein J4558_14050 [Leptolyngbya sp. 15MV]|nr:hypothetical protein J4558_14050 [Leptolyngbya sp. 15MV]